MFREPYIIPPDFEVQKMAPTSNQRKTRKPGKRPLDGGLDPVRDVATRMNLKEGEEAVRRILREVYRRGKVGTKDLARATRLPIPVAAAIRRELEKGGIVARKGGATLTEAGKKYVEENLGMTKLRLISSGRQGERTPLTGEHEAILVKLREHANKRPAPLPQLDQAHATPETALRRALYMLEKGDLAGRAVLFLGDDDLTSVAAGLLGVARRLTVVDVDERLLDTINEISEMEELGIECVHHDLREPLPEGFAGEFDTFFTDPPYTSQGLRLFLSRGVQALRSRKTANVYVAFADKPPLEMLEVHRAILGMGLFVEELLPRFNEYEGAEIFANTTFLARLTATEEAEPAMRGAFQGEMYTGEVRPTLRVYRCRCGEEIEVGTGREYTTVEELKSRGCPGCGSKEGFRLRKRVRLRP
jgi:predicted methyltransferase